MRDFTALLERKLVPDPDHGIYARPKLPATKVGKALMRHKDIANPKEVLMVIEYGNLLSGGSHVLTGTTLYYPDGKFFLEDLRSTHPNNDRVECQVNVQGAAKNVILKTEDLLAARALSNVLDAVVYADKADDLAANVEATDYAQLGYGVKEIDWLQLRDEVLKTVDLLHERFQQGKLSLNEYELKKMELLDRL